MKLYIKQKAFSFADKFYVRDDSDFDRYYVEGEIFTLGKKLHVYGTDHSEVMYVSQKPFSFLPKVDIYIGESHVGTLVKEFTLFTQEYTFDSSFGTFGITGDFWAHEYEITLDGFPAATVSKEWFTWGDSYALDISSGEELVFLGILLAIDIITAAQASSAAN